MNWVVGFSPEVVLGSSGKTTAGNPSRLCKKNLAKNFMSISNLSGAIPTAKKSLANLQQGQIRASRYSDLKHLAKDYMEAKTRLVNKLWRGALAGGLRSLWSKTSSSWTSREVPQ